MKSLMGLIVLAMSLPVAASADVNWETVLVCDNGAAFLQVDSGERRKVRFVVQEPAIITYFLGTGAFRNAGTNFGNGRQFIATSWVQQGIFAAHDFHGVSGNYNYGDSFTVMRENSGMKILLRHFNSWTACDGDISPSTGMCNGNSRSGTDVHDYANWYFQDCR
jgi:hypothetical protein